MPKSPIEFYAGDTLKALASTYLTLVEVVCEQVQNALDASAKTVWIVVNLAKGFIHVRDDGDGVSLADFEKALTELGKSQKPKGKLGRFGRGLISPLGKCAKFFFVSTPKPESAYREWTFDTGELFGMKSFEGIDWRHRPDLIHGTSGLSRGKSGVPWRSEVRVEGITDDRQISEMSANQLRERIRDRYNGTLLGRKARVNIRFTDRDGVVTTLEPFSGRAFEGTALERTELNDSEFSKATFEMYLRRFPNPRGRVNLTFGQVGDEFGVSYSDFAKSVEGYLPSEVMSALGSGYFEGRISSTSAKLHPNRKRFEVNDGLISFCLLIENWFDRIGRDHFKAVQSQKRESYWQAIGQSVMRVLNDLVKAPGLEHLLAAIEEFEVGSVGVGHKKPEKAIVVGKDEAVMGAQGTHLPHDCEPDRAPKPDRELPPRPASPSKDHPGHRPGPVQGPRGGKRLLVKGDSKGVHLEFATERSEMINPERFWELETERGIIRFNTRHHAWMVCESEPKALGRLLLQSIVLALFSATYSDEARADAARYLDDAMGPLAFVFSKGDKLLAGFIRQVKFPRPPSTAKKAPKADEAVDRTPKVSAKVHKTLN